MRKFFKELLITILSIITLIGYALGIIIMKLAFITRWRVAIGRVFMKYLGKVDKFIDRLDK